MFTMAMEFLRGKLEHKKDTNDVSIGDINITVVITDIPNLKKYSLCHNKKKKKIQFMVSITGILLYHC